MDPDVTKITEVFLVPNSIMVPMLGVANTDGLKMGVSLIGTSSCTLWLCCSVNALDPNSSFRVWVLALLPLMFIAFWLVSAVYHGCEFLKERAKRKLGEQAVAADAAPIGPVG
jgi:hypothetical protein